ncbi:MAG TPA: transposase [Anaerolineales bacterium]|nr:transposase [Anaerolineales bacterium]
MFDQGFVPPMPASHHPPHIYLDDTWYMVTAATRGRSRLLKDQSSKALVRDNMASRNAGIEIRAWVILDDHDHVLLKTHNTESLPAFIRQLHGRTSFELNTRDGERGRQVWHNDWDTCIRTEIDLWTRFNYIHHNPVKHGYVTHPENWELSSLGWFLEHEGREWVKDAFRRYPVVSFTDRADRFHSVARDPQPDAG